MARHLEAEIDEAATALREGERVVVFSGAGISHESGIATFRERGGLWQRYPTEQFATWSGLARTAALRPAELARFVHDVLAPIAHAVPNPAHYAVAELTRHAHATVITQNVDGLHQEAGAHGVRQLHGSALEVADWHGRVVRRLSRDELRGVVAELSRARTRRLPLLAAWRALRPIAGLSYRGLHRPNLVMFGEPLRQPDWDDALRGVEQCDVMVVVGTSGMVMPAAELPSRAQMGGATVILVDPAGDMAADIHLRGKAGELLPELVNRAFGHR